jgi:enterochelin esterase-like enzyme
MSRADTPPPTIRRLAVLLDPALVVGVAALVAVSAVVSGTMDSSNLTLVFMGFDQDRAQLITSLLIAGVAAAAATLVTNKSRQATLAGLGVFTALILRMFLVETRNAVASTGADGSFDPIGWLSTLLTLLVAAAIVSWIGAVLAQAPRPGLIEAGSVIRAAVRSRRLDRRLLRQPVAVAVVTILLIFSVPIFGDIVNYTPDSRMLHGGAQSVGLVAADTTDSPEPPGGSPSAGPSSASPVPRPGSFVPPSTSSSRSPGASTSSPGSQPTRSAQPNQRPWLAWRPSGSGAVTEVNLPAPWTGGSATTENIDIYTPPGYDPTGSRRYPVLYEAPFDYGLWDSSVNIRVALDTMIDRGTVPAMIVVFINAWRAPIYDTECADSVDGRQWFDTFNSKTVVSYVDSSYRTIAKSDARAFTGFSAGGYCAAILPLRHPEVFATSIPISGYFRAGEGDASAKLPFGGDAAALAAASPMVVVATRLRVGELAGLFFIVVAKPSEPFFGTEAVEFEQLLATEGYDYVAVNSKLGHGWNQVRQELPGALEAWAAHLVAVGLFQSSPGRRL